MTGSFETTDNITIGKAGTGEYAVLFADIVGSSKLYLHLGNVRAQREIDRLLTLMIQVVQAHGGQLVKTIGDEIMVIFDEPECAAESAIAINLKVQEESQSVRTGMSFGTVIFDGLDAFGNTVNRAASLVRAAHSKQILLDQDMFEHIPYWLLNCCDMYDRLILKGSNTKSMVYRLNWQADDSDLNVTQVNSSLVQSQINQTKKLKLSIGPETYYFQSSDQPLTIGRDPALAHCVVANPRVSRLHCVIAYHRGKYIFEDRSTNGSYLQEQSQSQLYLRRESAPLISQGQITLGQPEAGKTNTIEFRHVSCLCVD